MLSGDIARLYEVETKQLNQAVKRNEKRFPEDFCFQLTKEEYEYLKFQIGTSSLQDIEVLYEHGGRRKLPYVYTEQGIAMLSAVLRSDIAIKVSVRIMQIFVELRRYFAQGTFLIEKVNDLEINQIEERIWRKQHPFFRIIRRFESNGTTHDMRIAAKYLLSQRIHIIRIIQLIRY